MERQHLACLGAAALLLLCGIVQIILFAGSDPDLLALSLEEAAATVEPNEPAPPFHIAVFPPAGEDSGAVEAAMRKRFEGKAGWKVLDRDLMDEAVRDHGAAVNPRPRSAQEAKVAGRKLGVEAAFWADVSVFRQTDELAEVSLKWGLVRIPAGEAVAEGSASVAKRKGFFSLDRYRARIDGVLALYRIFFWFVTLLVLPVALTPLNEKLLEFRNNAASAALLAFYTVALFVLMLLLNGFRIFTVFWGIAGVIVLAGTALYTLAVLNALTEG